MAGRGLHRPSIGPAATTATLSRSPPTSRRRGSSDLVDGAHAMAFAYKEAAIAADRQALPRFELAREFEAAPGRLRLSGRVTMLLRCWRSTASRLWPPSTSGPQAYLAVTGQGPEGLAFRPHLFVVALSLPIAYWLLDVYRVHGQAPIERFPLRIKATCVLFVLLFGWYYATQGLLWPLGRRRADVRAGRAAAAGRRAASSGPVLIRLGLWGVPTVVIGAGPIGRQVVRILQQAPELGLRPVGFFDDRHADGEGSPAGDSGPARPRFDRRQRQVQRSHRDRDRHHPDRGAGDGRRGRDAARLSRHHRRARPRASCRRCGCGPVTSTA